MSLELERRVRSGIERIEPYQPGITDDELRHRYGLTRVIKLNANENALGPSPLAIRAVQEELPHLHHYPDGASELLREAIAEFHGVTPAHVLVGNGSDDIIKLLSETFLDDGDEIIVPHPSFSQYAFGAHVMRATVKHVPLEAPDFAYDVERLAAAVGPRTKLVYVCSPNNPTGGIMTRAQARWLLGHLPKHVLVVFDFAYNDYSQHPERVREEDGLLDDPRVIGLHTFSKLYGLAGLRVGYGLAHPAVWSYVHRVREPFNVNRVAQRAAAAALRDESHRRASVALAARARSQYTEALRQMGLPHPMPEGNFILVQTGDGRATAHALMQRGILVRAGFSGLDAYVRITYGLEEENEACLAALREVVQHRG
ncbi:MAG: histidinol-phosphate transaminase [Thermoflavifilum sp.]|nr:histidinol-phosphate transaminase [Thermoflavifilum sp.]MCL6514631.1 histidinol-phosphate transaminase [Alicyclobacillus sp.]